MRDAGGGARALREHATATIVARLRDLDFWDDPGTRECCWWMISANADVTDDVLTALPDKPWELAALDRNAGVSRARLVAMFGDRARYRYGFAKADFAFADAQALLAGAPAGDACRARYYARPAFAEGNPNMTWKLFRDHFGDLPDACLANAAVANAAAVRAHPEFPWAERVGALAANEAFGDEALRALQDVCPEAIARWPWDAYSWSRAACWRVVARHPDAPWDMLGLSRNPKVVDWARLRAMPDGPLPGRAWNWRGLSANPAVATPERVRAHPELPWAPDCFANNRAMLRWGALGAAAAAHGAASVWRSPWAHAHAWCRAQLFGDDEREAWARRWMAARRVQRAWRAAYETPGAPIWRRRMLREFAELGEALAPAAGAAAAHGAAVAAAS